MICGSFPLPCDGRQATNSTRCSMAGNPTTGNRCPPLGKEFGRFGFGMPLVASGVIYVAKFADAIYVLHCFQKKAQRTSKADLDLATKRYRDLVKELGL